MTRRPRRGRGRDRRRLASWASERGSASVELVIVFPVVLLLLFMGMQGALLYQAKATAMAAAQEGARVAAGESGSAAEGRAAAEAFVRASALGTRSATVNGGRNGADTEATYVVSVTSQSIVPLWDPTVTQSATMPVERITG